MPRVFIDMERLRNPHSGLGQFCLHLGKALLDQNNADFESRFYVRRGSDNIFVGERQQYRVVTWVDKFLGVPTGGCDIWHATHQDTKFLPRDRRTKVLLTVHDLNFLDKYRSQFKRAERLRRLQRMVNRASALVTVSRFTQQILRENIDVADIPIEVIYNGNPLQNLVAAKRPGLVPPGDFIFAIGIISAKKNFHILLPLLIDFPGIRLIIAGSTAGDYANYILAEADRIGVRDRVILPGKVDDAERLWLYQHCRAFVFPSLSEGFGLPAVEALSLGKPVFLSSLTSLPEIGGDAAYYWQNFSPEHVVGTFRAGLRDYDRSPSKPDAIRQWASQYSWNRAAQQYQQLYADIADKPVR